MTHWWITSTVRMEKVIGGSAKETLQLSTENFSLSKESRFKAEKERLKELAMSAIKCAEDQINEFKFITTMSVWKDAFFPAIFAAKRMRIF